MSSSDVPGNSSSSGAGCTTAPESWCAPTARPLSTSAIGTSPSFSATAGSPSSSCAEADRAGQPGRPAADDRDADLELLVGRRLGRGDDLGRRERRRVRSGGGRHAAIVLRRLGRGRRIGQVALACECHLADRRASTLSAMPIDLRSDTVTRPTPAMREAMATAPVGDDVYGEDETVNALERRAAELCGREAALFVPSGTMGNQIGVALWAGQGDEVYAHRDAHILIDEAGGIGGAVGRAPARPAQPGLRARRRGAARRGADGRERHPSPARPRCSASRTRTRARAGACGRPRRSSA